LQNLKHFTVSDYLKFHDWPDFLANLKFWESGNKECAQKDQLVFLGIHSS
jgi:hypothetical protein